MLSNVLDKISFWVLFAVIVLLPVFFLPFTQIPVETSKGLLLVIGLSISIIFWILARFYDGKISLPKSWLLLSGVGIVLIFLISALFSSSPEVSMFGIMLDVGTFYFMLGAFFLMFFSSIFFKNKVNVKKVFFGLIVFSVILFIFQGLRLFLPELLSLGVLGAKTDNILGSWNAFGIFVGFFSVVSLFIIEFFSVSKIIKWILGILLIFSIFLIMAVNLPLIWALLGFLALLIFSYKVSFFSNKRLEGVGIHFPFISFIIIMVSLLFVISGQFLGGFLPNYLGLSNVEVNPSFISTIEVTKDALIQNPILGVGPNKFAEVWVMYKPEVINSTQFWDSSFNFGSGLLPTFASTTGSLGILAWLVFFILFIILGIKSVIYSIKNSINYETVLVFLSAFYLFIASFFYPTGGVTFLLAFAFTGVFIGLYFSNHPNGEFSFSFLNEHRKSFFSMIFLLIMIIIFATFSFKYIERLISLSYFGKTFSATTILEAQDSVIKALSFYQNDLYLRTYSQVYLTKINSIVSKGTSALSDEDKADLQASFGEAINGAQLAINYNNKNYLNYTSLGVAYNTALLLGVEGAYDKSIEAYKTASTLNPLNPGIKLSLARVYFDNKKTKEARDYIKESLNLKPDYVDALIFASQLEEKDGNHNLAVSYAEQALSLFPGNKDLIDYVNFLKNKSLVAPSLPSSLPEDTETE